MLQLTCLPGSHAVEIAHQGEITEETMQAIYDSIGSLPPLELTGGEVKFQVQFIVASNDRGEG